MNTSSRTYVRLSVIIFSVAICLVFLFPGNNANADSYEFTWTANHANDNVTTYEIYYRSTTSEGYNSVYVVAIENVYLVSPEEVKKEIFRDEIPEGYCFAIKAVDEEGYRSDFSDNEVGRDEEACDKNPNDLPFIEDNGNPQVSSSSGGGGGGGGGCFLNLIR